MRARRFLQPLVLDRQPRAEQLHLRRFGGTLDGDPQQTHFGHQCCERVTGEGLRDERDGGQGDECAGEIDSSAFHDGPPRKRRNYIGLPRPRLSTAPGAMHPPEVISIAGSAADCRTSMTWPTVTSAPRQ